MPAAARSTASVAGTRFSIAVNHSWRAAAESLSCASLADLNLSIDGHRTSYEVLRELAATVTGGRWLALGGGGYSPVRVVPRAWTHLLAIVSGHDIDPTTPLPAGWLAHAATASPETPLPEDMSDGTPHPVPFRPWDGSVEQPVDRAIQDTRTAVYPLHGLDPYDPRD